MYCVLKLFSFLSNTAKDSSDPWFLQQTGKKLVKVNDRLKSNCSSKDQCNLMSFRLRNNI